MSKTAFTVALGSKKNFRKIARLKFALEGSSLRYPVGLAQACYLGICTHVSLLLVLVRELVYSLRLTAVHLLGSHARSPHFHIGADVRLDVGFDAASRISHHV